MSEGGDQSAERTFLHDLCNLLAISQGNLHLLMRKIQKNPGDMKPEDLVAKLEVSLNSVNKITDLVNQRRSVLKGESPA